MKIGTEPSARTNQRRLHVGTLRDTGGLRPLCRGERQSSKLAGSTLTLDPHRR